MTKRTRITILSVCGAAGVGLAIALAMSTRPEPSARAPVVPPGPQLTATARVVPESAQPPLTTTDAGAAEAAAANSTPTFVPLSQLPGAQTAYRLFTQQLQNLEESFDHFRDSQDRRQRDIKDALSELQDKVDDQSGEPSQADDARGAAAGDQAAAESLPPAIDRTEEGKLRLSLEDADVRDALKLLSHVANFDIMASKNVTGTVTASLRDVDVDTALAAILKSAGLVARHEQGIVYVGTPADFTAMDQTQDRVLMRVYRPNYIKAAELLTLITPMLSTTAGKATVSSPAEVDIASDQTKTGGNNFAGPDVVVVRDYEAILKQIDELYAQVDVNPRQVAIEAMIINVKLDDEYRMGVNWEALRGQNNVRLVINSPLDNLANLPTADGGLNFGFLDTNLAFFIDALEKVGDTNVIASPRVLCLNKQRAEIQIGEQLGYVNTTVTQTFSTQSVSFLDVGTLLRIRPFIHSDGQIRMEVHPELSTGSVTVDAGLTLPNKSVTQVTTNVMCPDGQTIVIGGLIREDLKNNVTQVPYFGNLPWVGPLFRNKTEEIERSEIIVLITPRIVGQPQLADEGAKYEHQFVERHSVVFDKLSPIARRNYALRYQRLARAAMAAGDFDTALRQIDWSLQFDSMNRDAIMLREEIVAAGGFNESIPEYLNSARHPQDRTKQDYSQQGYPWRGAHGPPPEMIVEPEDPGLPGPTTTIEPKLPAGPAFNPLSNRPTAPELSPAPMSP